jgi:hypothetical protein
LTSQVFIQGIKLKYYLSPSNNKHVIFQPNISLVILNLNEHYVKLVLVVAPGAVTPDAAKW